MLPVSQGEEHVSKLEQLRYLVIDEADRMVEQGHFQELSSILDLIHRTRQVQSYLIIQPVQIYKRHTPFSSIRHHQV